MSRRMGPGDGRSTPWHARRARLRLLVPSRYVVLSVVKKVPTRCDGSVIEDFSDFAYRWSGPFDDIAARPCEA